MGAIPYILKEVNVPIYATKLTIAIIEHKLEEHNMLNPILNNDRGFSTVCNGYR